MVQFDVNRIDTRIGTYNSHDFSNGNTLPLTCAPHGMNLFSIQTTHQNGNWWFNPYEPIYQGIKLTHQASPWIGDYNDFLITPITGKLDSHDIFKRQSSYDTESAIFSPNFLKITSHRFQVTTELVPSLYGANLKIYSNNNQAVSLIFTSNDLIEFKRISDKTVVFKTTHFDNNKKDSSQMYGAITFKQNILEHIPSLTTHFKNLTNNTNLVVSFTENSIEFKLATSFISEDQALLNLERLKDFQTALDEVTLEWNSLLNRITIEDKNMENIQLFYHCLYRCLIFPQTTHEINHNKQIVHFNHDTNKVCHGKYFVNIGFWDAFRSLLPLLILVYPEYIDDILEGVLNYYNETHFLPKWLAPYERSIMPGTLVDGFITDCLKKGFYPSKVNELLFAMEQTASTIDENGKGGRIGVKEYNNLGYLPYTYTESISHTLDYAYSDWCISEIAKLLKQENKAKYYRKRSQGYRSLFHAQKGYLIPKDSSNNFINDVEKYEWGKYYAECSTIQATLCAYHDIKGITKLLGGKKEFTDYLIKLCNDTPLFNCKNYGYEIHEMSEMAQSHFGQLAISNQPSFHIPYLFQLSQKTEYTSYLIQRIRQESFSNTFSGFPGDEDNGSLSAWYILSCLGFFPICPGENTYYFGAPAFQKLTIQPNNIRKQPLEIYSNNLQQSHHFVNHIICDGKKISSLDYETLIQASSITFNYSLLP